MRKIIVFLYISIMAISFTAPGATDSTGQIQQFHITYTQYRNYHEPGMNTTESTVLSIDHTGKVKVTTTRADHTKRKPKEKKCRESTVIPNDELKEFTRLLAYIDLDSLLERYEGERASDLDFGEKMEIKIGNNKKEITIRGDAEIPQVIGSITFFLGEMRKKYLKKCD